MPLIKSKYKKRPWYLPHPHLETVIPSLFFKINDVAYERERLELSDGDFLDLDWLTGENERLIILSHGLEGSADRHYIQRPAKYFYNKKWDILAWNNRSCSGEMNRLPRFYHHGATEDISAVIDHALTKPYQEIVLIGFSMGGGMQQKYLGERVIDGRIKGAISFSVPCNIQDSADKIGEKGNRFYEQRFINKLRAKILQKAAIMTLPVNIEEVKAANTFQEFDSAFTLKIHTEFKDTEDFYQTIASDQYLPNIDIPLLIVNAKNDPMLGEKCYPTDLARKKDTIYLEVPKQGGHVGFTTNNFNESYMELAAYWFIEEVLHKCSI